MDLLNIRIKDVCIYRYGIPFKEPVQIGKRSLKTRNGLVVGMTDEEGITGYGEIAPLYGFSKETPAQAEKQVFQLAGKLAGMSLIKEFSLLCGDFSQLVPGLIPYPSVIFGLETAAVNLLQRYMKKVFPEFTAAAEERKIPVNALLHSAGPLESVEDSVKEILAKGFKTIKIKVGRDSLAEDIERINRAAGILPPGVLIRVDANQRWDFQRAVAFAKGINDNKGFIEYIEEPFRFKNIRRLGQFYEETGIPTALDETLPGVKPGDLQIPEGLAALVLKPTLLGGFGQIGGFTDLARQHGLKPIISSCFEAGPGFAELCKIVSTIDFDDSASGLDTLKYLESNLFSRPVTIEDGGIPMGNLLDATGLYNFDLLRRCPSGDYSAAT
jgi:o-succinylbenzoate synthase